MTTPTTPPPLAPHWPPRTVDDLCDAVAAALEVLREAGQPDIPADDVPGTADACRWIREAFTDKPLPRHRKHGGSPVRMTRASRRGISRQSRALRGMLRWHLGRGQLDGLIMARMEAGREYRDQVALLAGIMLVLDGRRSTALDRWADVLGLDR